MVAQRVSRPFLLAFFGAFLVVVAIGWFTGIREVMHSVLVGLLVAALLPILIILGAVALVIGFAVVCMIIGVFTGADGAADVVSGAGDAASGAVEFGLQTTPAYYRMLGRIRHPAIWGGVVGMLAGGLTLWGLVAWLIVPGETVTSRILAEAAERLARIHQETGSFPSPTPERHLRIADLEGGAAAGPVCDGFGRPLLFHAAGRGVFASFTLRSLGFDGKDGRDDFCVSGSGKGAKWTDRLRSVLSFIRTGKDQKPSKLSDRLETLRALRCEE